MRTNFFKLVSNNYDKRCLHGGSLFGRFKYLRGTNIHDLYQFDVNDASNIKTRWQSEGEDNDSEQFVKENDEEVKLEKFAENLTSNTSKTNSKKSAMPYKTYTSQIVDFIGLIVDQAQIKDTAAKTGITLSTAYRYQKMWN